VHKGKNITCERKLVNIQTGQSLGTTDAIHALVAVFYSLVSNSDAVCPLFDRDLKSTENLMQYFNEITEVKGTERGRNKRKKEESILNIC
jgi:truncated hemoglobin YjbI